MTPPLVEPLNWRPTVYRVRGEEVILDSDLARALGLETKRLNERIRRNADLVDERHCFLLTAEEFAALRSQSATSKRGRGGRQHLPRVFLPRGVARVATFIDTPAALRASDLIIETFMSVQRQVAAGKTRLEIEAPSRFHQAGDGGAQAHKLRQKLIAALDRLLDTVIDARTSQSVRETARELTAGALENIRERLRTRGLENVKLDAETQLVLAEAEKIAAAVRRSDAEVEGLHLDNLTKRIAIVRDMIKLQQELEPNQVVQLLERFDDAHAIELSGPPNDGVKRLPRPKNEDA